MNLQEAIEQFDADNNTHRTEGQTGVRNLCKLVHALGYVDDTYFGQFEGASYGDLINFLEDNSGAVEAIKEWIADQNNEEWTESLGYTEDED